MKDYKNEKKLSKEYLDDLRKGYFEFINNKKCLKPKFIVEYPESIANNLWDKKKNKLSQIWKFYDHARRIQDSLKQKDESLDILRAELNELKPAVVYACTRDTVTEVFKKFITENVSQIKDRDDLDAFIKHFQALIAYLPRDNQK